MKSISTIIIISILILLIDIFLYFKYIQLVNRFSASVASLFKLMYWFVPIFYLIFTYIMLSEHDNMSGDQSRVYWISGIFIVLYIPKIIALGISFPEYIINGIGYLVKKISEKQQVISVGKKLSRIEFISQFGFISAGILFWTLLWGVVVGKTKFVLNKITLNYNTLPNNFNGFKIIQISDIHLGSWSRTESNRDFFESVVQTINNEKPDIIVFTGDLVNNIAKESDYWVDYLKALNAKYGKFSILGNHDYGKYARWLNKEELNANMEHLYNNYKNMGFRLLLNETESINIGGESIKIVGVENWGMPPFPQFGDYEKASETIKKNDFQILLSHDPSHWEQDVRFLDSNVALTLSGHTHGMQFALNFNGMSWSPIQWKYKHWRGLYTYQNKDLYVNIGLGNIAYPGRVGTPPEITLLELSNVNT